MVLVSKKVTLRELYCGHSNAAKRFAGRFFSKLDDCLQHQDDEF